MAGILKKEQDNPSIGLLLCKSKNDLVAEYSLKDMSKPIGVSAYQITSNLPEELERQLPSVEDIQKRIKEMCIRDSICPHAPPPLRVLSGGTAGGPVQRRPL